MDLDHKAYNHPQKGSQIMRKRFPGLFLCFFVFLAFAVLLESKSSRATLGEPVQSIESDKKALSATRSAKTEHNGYTVQEIQSGATFVRQYVSPSGIVFAIAWNGLVHPDLTQLLGPYFKEYQIALEQTPRRQGSKRLKVKTNGVVVEKWGHIRNLEGRAYAPELIPAGVSIDEIK
ncbi:MAG: hypothetical protein A4E57_01708 [Syntrophorhabdaceae bacterium PtaU1.Bin034]|jgi:hypothetical protein|nr:MAG: hypothetical protein A4E57_01708 [Syntrophorhabdaceae bacterium PtaU1.Bin034]